MGDDEDILQCIFDVAGCDAEVAKKARERRGVFAREKPHATIRGALCGKHRRGCPLAR
jgi:hypothetical protein